MVCEDGQIVSVASIHRNTSKTAIISGFYTNPEYRNRGYAHRVVDCATAEISKKKKLLPLLFCYEDNIPARRVYEDLGFQIDEACVTSSLVG